MRKVIFTIAMLGLLAGCSSTPTKPSAAVEEGKASVAHEAPAPKPAGNGTSSGLATKSVTVDPLKDPNNILSKRSVYFDFDSNVIKDQYKPMITAHAKYIEQHPSAHVVIQGNTDERGSREYNLALGQRRADAVKQMMSLLGAPTSQIETVSFGEEKPKALGENEKAWAENRRADIVYQHE